MSKVDFHILDGAENSTILKYTCRLVRKAYKGGFRVYIRSENEQEMKLLDTLLWTFSELDFIPHATLDTECGQEAVIIGMIERPGDSKTVLINLSTQMTDNFASYSRVFELIGNNPVAIDAGRDRYRKYRNMNVELSNHHVAAN